MRTVTNDFYLFPQEPVNRTTAPVSEVESFLAARCFRCELLAASITPEQCAVNRAKRPYMGIPTTPCYRCTQERPQAQPEPAKKPVHKSASPWRQNPEFIAKGRRQKAFERVEHEHRNVCPGDAVGDTGAGVAPPKPRQAGRQAGRHSSPQPEMSPEVMTILRMVQDRLQRGPLPKHRHALRAKRA